MAAFKMSKKLILTLLTLIFIVPMISAWLAFSKGIFLSGNKVNHGTLLQPPVSIFNLSLSDSKGHVENSHLRGKWWLVYLTNEPTGSLSQKNLYYIHQIRQATGKNRDRIERAVITTNSQPNIDLWIKKNYPGMYRFTISNEKLQQFEESLPKKLALEKGSLYLVDPLGNIVLFYAPNAAPKGILKDLERVLKVSQIG